MATATDAAQSFVARLNESPIKVAELAAFLDGLAPQERVEAIRAAGRREQRSLWKAVDGFGEVRLVDIVPPRVADLATVRHHGRNTLPLFTHFEKRFCRPPGRAPENPGELWGFNFQTLAPLTGPGYFVVREDRSRGEAWVDYREVPPEAPPGWPPVRDNEGGLGRFIYGGMVDTLRRVSEHVTIGSAARAGREMGSWFLLCREA
jgi:hypothetical protein